jgi:signal transduction histidine kinase
MRAVRMTLTVKLALAFTALALVAALPGTFLVWRVRDLQHQTSRSRVEREEQDACKYAHGVVLNAMIALQNHAASPHDPRFEANSKQALESTEDAIRAAALVLTDKDAAAALQEGFADLERAAEPLFAPPVGATPPSADAARQAGRAIATQLDQLSANLDQSRDKRDESVATTVDRLAYVGRLGLFATAVLTLGLSLAIGRAWRRRMVVLSEGVARVARGDLRVRIDDREGDEVGALARTFNSMVGELQILEEMKSQFVAVASHELRTPLTLIDGYCGILLNPAKGQLNEWQQQRIELIHSQVGELLSLLQDLLDAERLQTRALEPVLEPVEPAALAGNIVDGFEASARSRGLELHLSVEAGAPRSGRADVRALTRVLRNLIENALKYTEAGKVDVRLSGNSNALVLEIEDTGCGISAEELPRIFGRFYQVNDGRPRRGFGLGLSIVRGLVERNGGQIAAKSELGRGSTFTVSWPLGLAAQREVG